MKKLQIKLSLINVIKSFPLFAPSSAGEYRNIARLTIKSVNQTIPALARLVKDASDDAIELQDVNTTFNNELVGQNIEVLKQAFRAHRCEKAANPHHLCLYSYILGNRESVASVVEIGLGTNNPDVPSHMVRENTPGSSLRGFRDFLPSATVYGCDIDKRVLFQEERIETFFLDQTDPSTFVDLDKSLPNEVDLFIDDGLHAPNANIESLRYGLKKIKIGGWVVIEDIGGNTIPLWTVVAKLVPDSFETFLFDQGGGGAMFAAKRVR